MSRLFENDDDEASSPFSERQRSQSLVVPEEENPSLEIPAWLREEEEESDSSGFDVESDEEDGGLSA